VHIDRITKNGGNMFDHQVKWTCISSDLLIYAAAL